MATAKKSVKKNTKKTAKKSPAKKTARKTPAKKTATKRSKPVKVQVPQVEQTTDSATTESASVGTFDSCSDPCCDCKTQ